MSTPGYAVQESADKELRSGSQSSVVAAARHRLGASPYRAIHCIDCSFEQGRLRLSGKLRSFFHKQLAQEAVARLPGVIQVINDIEVSEAPHVGSQPLQIGKNLDRR